MTFVFLYRVTCVYLACKIEEFNLTITQFVANIRGDREKATDIILNNELLLMSALKFHLTIHNPYRPVEGLLIDIKTRFPHLDAETLRPHIEEFLDKVLLTDIPLLYSPSQVSRNTSLFIFYFSLCKRRTNFYCLLDCFGKHTGSWEKM